MKRTLAVAALTLGLVASLGMAGFANGEGHSETPAENGEDARAPAEGAGDARRGDVEYAVARGWLSSDEGSDQTLAADQIADLMDGAFPAGATRADLATFVWSGAMSIRSFAAVITPDVFPDVTAADHPQRADIDNGATQEWFRGYPDGNFRPDRAVTDAQTAKVVSRAFPDGMTRAEASSFLRAGNRGLLDRGRPPAESDEPTYTKYFVQAAIDRYRDQGRQAAFAYYNSTDSVNGQWYVFIIENSDTIVHPTRPELRGTTPTHRTGIYGKPYGLELVAADEDGVWVDYVFLNTATGQNRQKHTWAVRHDDLIFASGWYEDQVPPPPGKDDPPAYTQYFVQQAIDRYQRDGRAATIDYYNSMDSIDGPWYIFIIEDGTTISIATNPELVGTATTTRTDVNGKNYGRELAAADERGAWVDYVRRNPDSEQLEQKHSWVLRRDGLIFGSGWYEPVPTTP